MFKKTSIKNIPMCGITLLLSKKYIDDESTKKAMKISSENISKRGPDFCGEWEDPQLGISTVHRRLAIVNPNSGPQPIFSKDGDIILIVNGEIYNHEQILQRKVVNSDCEAIIELYEHYRDMYKVLHELDGVFAFCLIDKQEQKLYIARDRFGICPLYIGRGDDIIMVSSELKGITMPLITECEQFKPGCFSCFDLKTDIGPCTTKNVSGIDHVLCDYETFVKLPLQDTIQNDIFDDDNESFKIRIGKRAEHIRYLLTKAVLKRLGTCDVPIGVFLSGGLDSRIVAEIISKSVSNPIHTFSIGCEDSSDLQYARLAAKKIGSMHHEYIYTTDEAFNSLSQVIRAVETYDITTIRASTPMFLLAEKIKQLGIKVVLSGEGADELFGGYLYFHDCPTPKHFQEETERKLDQLYHYDVLRANKTCAAWGIEIRVPFLDRDLVNYVLYQVDPIFKMPIDNYEKYLLRVAFIGDIEKDILWRRKEQFSDGVGHSWIDQLIEKTSSIISDDDFESRTNEYPYQTPLSKEGYYYRMLFSTCFPFNTSKTCVYTTPSVACSSDKALEWCMKENKVDPSGRSVSRIYNH